MNERMEFDVIINGKKAKAELKNIEKDTKHLEESTVKSNSVMSDSWVTLGLKVAAASLAMKASISAYEKQFKAEVSLSAAMKNNTSLVDTNIGSWKRYASAVQEWSNVGDDAVLQQLAFLNTLGMTDDQMKVTIQTAADMANSGMMSFDSAVRNLAKSLSGMSGELGEAIPALRELTAEQLKAGEGITLVSEAVRGQSDAIANSPVGKWNALWNSAGDSLEKVGKSVLNLLDSLNILSAGSIFFDNLGYAVDLFGLNVEKAGWKVRELWNIVTFDSEEAAMAQRKINDINAEYSSTVDEMISKIKNKSDAMVKVNTDLNLEADATAKALDEEMKKIYADELAALGLNEQGDELERVNDLLSYSADAYGDAASAADSYANSINSLTSTMSASEQNSGTSGVYATTTTSPGEYVNTLNPYTYTTLTTDAFGNSIDQFGFASGGYTGDVGTSDVAGVVHGQEYVVDAQTTKDLGLNGSGGIFSSMDDKLGALYDINKSLVKVLRYTKDNSEKLERIATA